MFPETADLLQDRPRDPTDALGGGPVRLAFNEFMGEEVELLDRRWLGEQFVGNA
ncbi:hypothetical protein [Streptomyces sp. NPDC056628]|uniref:hypothetical protein n=1 Tax=Streptomyces sp. NPDC056628 TaxID=3345882 RepID=UPI0036BF369E